jgi:phosphoglycolate phosphatase-like HAD superfamily hydrolase
MIGDTEGDVEAGRAAGCRTVRVGASFLEAAREAMRSAGGKPID